MTERGQKEALEMKKILSQQRDRIAKRQEEIKAVQLSLFPTEEQRQIEADSRHWSKRLASLSEELTSEPARIEAAYKAKAVRIEPVGLIYLWSVSG